MHRREGGPPAAGRPAPTARAADYGTSDGHHPRGAHHRSPRRGQAPRPGRGQHLRPRAHRRTRRRLVVTTNPHHDEAPLLYPFPAPGAAIRIAFREIHLALNGSPEQKQQLRNPGTLPRPWEPASCSNPERRMELGGWLEEVVGWLNHGYSWDVTAMIP